MTMLRGACIFWIFLFACFNSFSQEVKPDANGNIFMKGAHMEIGISPCGSFGTAQLPPSGFHPRTNRNGLGFVADPKKSNWTDYNGDYFVPSNPFEGWGIQVGNSPLYNSNPSIVCSTSAIIGNNKYYFKEGGKHTAVWEGNANFNNIGALEIKQVVSFDEEDVSFTINVQIKNNSGKVIPELYYVRGLDPDNAAMSNTGYTSNHTTNNKIVYQSNSDFNKRSLVTAIENGVFLGLGTKDARSKVFFKTSGFENPRDLKSIWNGTDPNYRSELNAELRGDDGIYLAFQFKDIPNENIICFSYSYILNEADLDKALTSTESSSFSLLDGCSEIIPVSKQIRFSVNNFSEGNIYKWDIFNDNSIDIESKDKSITYSFSSSGNHSVRLTTEGACGQSSTVKNFKVDNIGIPKISGPSSICNNESIILTSNFPVGNQWSFNNTPIPGATGQTYSANQTGEYTVTVLNDGCTNTSEKFVVTEAVLNKPTITQNQNLCPGKSTELTAVGGEGNFQWNLNNSPITFAMRSSLTIFEPGQYSVTTKKGNCQVTSDVFTVNTIPLVKPVLSGNHFYCTGKSTELNEVSAIGGGDGTFIRWFKNNHVIPGATSKKLTVSEEGSYYVTASLAGCSETSNAIAIEERPEASISVVKECVGNKSKFSINTNKSEAIKSVVWDFGDGEKTSVLNPQHTYSRSGEFNVKLILNQGGNCNFPELIINGHFESPFDNNCNAVCGCPVPPPLAFTSYHIYKNSWGHVLNCPNALNNYNTFRVSTDNIFTNSFYGSSFKIGDHTKNVDGQGNREGKFLIVDGKESLPYGQQVYSYIQEISVEPFTDYDLSFWAARLTANVNNFIDIKYGVPPAINFGLMDGSLEEENLVFTSLFANGKATIDNNHIAPNAANVVLNPLDPSLYLYAFNRLQKWQNLKGTFNSGNRRKVKIVIVSYTNHGFGNDFGLDDLSVKKSCPSFCQNEVTQTIKIEECPFDCKECIPSFSPVAGKKYLLSAWVKEQHSGLLPESYTKSGIAISFNDGALPLNTFKPSGPIIDGWQRIEQAFTVPDNAKSFQIELLNEEAENVYFDDIRIHPFQSNMKSFVYDPSTQKLIAELDENNYATKYEYDDEGILIRVKKETERGVMTIKETRNNQSKIVRFKE